MLSSHRTSIHFSGGTVQVMKWRFRSEVIGDSAGLMKRWCKASTSPSAIGRSVWLMGKSKCSLYAMNLLDRLSLSVSNASAIRNARPKVTSGR